LSILRNVSGSYRQVIIYEHFSSGETKGKNDISLVYEGLFMAKTMLSCFSRLDYIKPLLILNERFSFAFDPTGGQNQYIVHNDEGERALFELCGSRPVVLIAPETQGLSARLALKVTQAGGIILGSAPGAVKIASDKARLLGLLADKGVPCPPFAVVCDQTTIKEAALSWGFPLVVKPSCGTGGEGSVLLSNDIELDEFLTSKKADSRGLIIQPFIKGFPASLSILATSSGKAYLVSVNEQKIALSESGDGKSASFRYIGGKTGLSEEDYAVYGSTSLEYLQELSQTVVDAIPGLMGYVGIDLIMTTKGPQVLEVNPRITTPLAFLGKFAAWNIAEALMEACLLDKLPSDPAVPKIDFTVEGLSC
jgi:hypothetical protein